MTYFASQIVGLIISMQTGENITTQDDVLILADNLSAVVQVFVAAFAPNRFTVSDERGTVASYLLGLPLNTELDTNILTELSLPLGIDGFLENVTILSAIDLGANTFQVVTNDYE